MVKYDCIGMDLQDETEIPSTENKILRFHLFGQCSKCKREIELVESMKTDSCENEDLYSFTGWKYECKCNNLVQIPEEAFDSIIDAFYEVGFVEENAE